MTMIFKERKWKLPAVVVLGGAENAVSVARSLGQRGLRVFAINHSKQYVRYSRFCSFVPLPDNDGYELSWEKFLLGKESSHLKGSILLACSDSALEIIIKNRERLSEKFVLDIMNTQAQVCLLNKLSTYDAAQRVGIPAPRFWEVQNYRAFLDIEEKPRFPLMIKPVYSHSFCKQFGRKYLLAHNEDGLRSHFDSIGAYDGDVILLEFIPGSDSLLCSYYTYLDENGEPLFDFTKRIIRRYPVNEGAGSYHITDHNEEVKDLALRLFRSVGLKGLANAEFKRDPRDGQLKLIECNARFTAADCLVRKSGIDLASLVYDQLTNLPREIPVSYDRGKRLWHPCRDFLAFLELKKRGDITFGQWLMSVMHRQTFPYFAWDDPLPSLAVWLHQLTRVPGTVERRLGRLVRRKKTQPQSARGETQ